MNYVLFFPDEMRAESLGCYGHPIVKTPNIDALAAEGTLFEQNYTAHPVCGPSRACLANGWYPHVDGRRTFYMPNHNDPNFFTHLNDAGFTACHVGKDDMFDRESMDIVFSEHYKSHRKDIIGQMKTIPETGYSMLYPPIAEENADQISDAFHNKDALDFIHKHSKDKKTFFMMVAYSLPQPPYTAPESYYHMYDPDEMLMQRNLDWMKGKPEFYQAMRKYCELEEQDASLFRKINAVYHGMISYIDTQIGQVVLALKDAGIYDETTIIICSDHGDYAGDAGQREKWPSDMTDMLTRVPLIIRRPGDVTRAAYCEGGYDTHEPWCFEPECFKGSVLEQPLVAGSLYYPKFLQQQEQPDTVCRVVMQRYKEWKLIVRTNGQNELYHMEDDPLEAKNLYGQPGYANVQNRLTQKMLNWLIHTSDVVPIEGRDL